MPTITPMLSYRDADAAITFLCEAFGFTLRYRLEMPDGRVGHAELALGDGLISLASAYPEMGIDSPVDLDTRYSQLKVDVPDVDAHYARALAAGAVVQGEPEDQPYGGRMYRAVDPEGHRWIFDHTARELSVDEIKAAYGAS